DVDDISGGGDVDENPGPGFFQLERFRMIWQLDGLQQISRGGVENYKAGIALISKADEDVFCGRVIARVISIGRKMDGLEELICAAVKDAACSVRAVRDEDAIGLGRIGHALWFVQAANGMNQLVGAQVKHFERIVSQRGHKQTPACQ